MEKISFELNRDQLIELKHKNNDLYQMIMSLKKEEKDYCETLDKEKLKKECELGYFCISDLFTKEQIEKAFSDTFVSRWALPIVNTLFTHTVNGIASNSIEPINPMPNVFRDGDLEFDVAYKHSKLVRAINEKKEIKIRVTPEQSEVVQKICFALGVKWGCGSAVVADTDYKFLYIKNFNNNLELSRGNGEGFFKTVRCKEYSFEKGAFV